MSKGWRTTYGNGSVYINGRVVTIEGNSGNLSVIYNKKIKNGKWALNLKVSGHDIKNSCVIGYFSSPNGIINDNAEAIVSTTVSRIHAVSHANVPKPINKFHFLNEDVSDVMYISLLINADDNTWGIVDVNGIYHENCGQLTNVGDGNTTTIGNVTLPIYPFIRIEFNTNTSTKFELLRENINNVPLEYKRIG